MPRLSLIAMWLVLSMSLLACSDSTSTEPNAGGPQSPGTVNQPAAGPPVTDDPQSRWNLATLYADQTAWRLDRDRLRQQVAIFGDCRSNLSDSAAVLLRCLNHYEDLQKRVTRLMSYAHMWADSDNQVSAALALKQESQTLAAEVDAATSFLSPEILSVGSAQVEKFLAEEPGLQSFNHYLHNILGQAKHTLPAEQEKLLAQSGPLANAPSSLYDVLTNADLPWPSVKLSGGKEIRLDQAGYASARQLPVQEDRRRVFEAFWGAWQGYERTLGVMLYSQMVADRYYAQAHGHPTTLNARLHRDRLPASIYKTLIEEVNTGLPTLHRYFRLRARLLGVGKLAYYDIYPPLVNIDKSFPLADAKRLVIEAVQPLGAEYGQILTQGLNEQWMDVYPRKGKTPGGYMQGSVYDLHPFILLNYHDDYESTSTLAHEWGHALHSYLTNRQQRFINSDYATSVAEVASIINELLLNQQMLRQASNPQERLYYLGMALESLRGTFFRQAMFAEFEQATHARVDAGESLTGSDFTQIYGDLLRRYHGHEGVVEIDPKYAVEWAYIPHFYNSFYVFQYATSIAAASQLVDDINSGDPAVQQRYLELLRAGGSDYPHELLLKAGVDLTSPTPYRALLGRMNSIMDEMEKILAEQAKLAVG